MQAISFRHGHWPTARHSNPPSCTETRRVASALAQGLHNAVSQGGEWVVAAVADLRLMDRWGLTMAGEPLGRYFDLGSIDDVDPNYPITPDETRALLAELAARHGRAGCADARPG